jgi:hypothetical protein
MSDHKSTIRYVGYRSLRDGGREFDFSFALGGAKATIVKIDVPIAFFRRPDQIAVQEAAGTCYEGLQFRLQTHETSPPDRFDVTAANVAQYRRSRKDPARRGICRRGILNGRAPEQQYQRIRNWMRRCGTLGSRRTKLKLRYAKEQHGKQTLRGKSAILCHGR